MISCTEICNWLFVSVTWLSLADVFSKRITIICIIALICFIAKKSKAKYTTRINKLIKDGENIIKTEKIMFDNYYVDCELNANFCAGALSIIESIYGTNHVYYTDFANTTVMKVLIFENPPHNYRVSPLTKRIGILKSVKTEIEHSWFFPIKQFFRSIIVSIFAPLLYAILVFTKSIQSVHDEYSLQGKIELEENKSSTTKE